MSMDVQRQIRENTLELDEFLKDLKGWEHTVKEKEKKILEQGASKDNKTSEGGAPPRRQLHSGSEQNGSKVGEASSKKAEVKKTPAKINRSEAQGDNSSKLGAASHTYEHFRSKWDDFDVDAALKALDEDEDEDDRPVKKVSKRELRPPRGSQPKQAIDKQSELLPREAAPVAHSLPQGKTQGRGASPMAAADRLSGSSFGFDDAPPNAASEKDLGNEYFKEGKYVRAIDCYSRSIALQPTAVAYANRAMAALKIRRFEDAELDCSEAISLDDRYIKAYARRGTARKELKKYLAAVEDFEFALRLEPENKELKKQYTEVEELHQKESGRKMPQRAPFTKERKEESIPPQQEPNSGKLRAAAIDEVQFPSPPWKVSIDTMKKNGPKEESLDADLQSTKITPADLQSAKITPTNLQSPKITPTEPPVDGDSLPSTRSPIPDANHNPNPEVAQRQARAHVREKKMAEVVAATQAAAARAAASAMAAVSRNIVAPRSSYEFELMWKGFDENKSSQVRLLKAMDPLSLPKVFKDSLSAPLLLEIIHSLQLLFPEDAELGVQILENLTKVGRFFMTVMFLTQKDKTGLRQLWDQDFINSPQGLQPRLQALRSIYRLHV